MGLKNCPACGKLMLENPRGVCPDCYAQEEQDELKVVEFLREAKKSSVEEIHQATGVKHRIIMRMIREKRILSDFDIAYPCESCGAPIHEGRICLACSKGLLEFASGLGKNLPSTRDTHPHMRYIKERDKE